MIKELYIKPRHRDNWANLLYFGRSIQPISGPWRSAEEMFPNEINDITPRNLRTKNPMSVGTGNTAQEAYDSALERLERRILKGEYDCIAVVDCLPIRNGALFYCYVNAELYKFKERDWSHPIRKDEPTYKRA